MILRDGDRTIIPLCGSCSEFFLLRAEQEADAQMIKGHLTRLCLGRNASNIIGYVRSSQKMPFLS